MQKDNENLANGKFLLTYSRGSYARLDANFVNQHPARKHMRAFVCV